MELPIVCTYKKIRNKYSSTNKIEDTIMVRYEDYMTENFTGISVKKKKYNILSIYKEFYARY